MATIPRVQQASESLVVSRAQGISPSQAAAPFEAITRSGLETNQLAEQSLQRDGETKAMQDFSNYQIELAQKQQELQQEYASNPEGYVQAYDDASTKLFNEIKGDTDNKYYSQVMEQRLQSAKPSMFKSAIQFEANQKSVVQKQRLTDSIDNLSLLVRQDPNQLKVAQAQVEGNIASASENALIENAEGVRQAAISQLHAAAVDSYINAGDTKSARELLAMDGFQDNLGYEATVKAENSISRIEKEQVTQYNTLFKEDPAKLATSMGVTGIDNIIEKQRELGVPENRISAIPNEQAAQLADQMNNAKDADQLNAITESLVEQVGEQHIGLALKDLKKNKLSETAAFTMLMNPTEDKQLMNAMFAMSRDDGEIKAKAASTSIGATNDIKTSISEKFSEIGAVIAEESPMGLVETAKMQGNLVDLATYFVANGSSIDEATSLAVDWLDKKTPRTTINNKLFGVPQGYDVDDVEQALSYYITNEDWSDFDAEVVLNKSSVYPVLSNDGETYYFKNKIGGVVYDKEYQPFKISVEDALLDFEEQRAERKERGKPRFLGGDNK